MTTQKQQSAEPKKYRSTFEAEYDVQFSDPDKAESFYVNGDFAKHIINHDDLDSVAEMFSRLFFLAIEQYDMDKNCSFKHLDDTGVFYKRPDGSWVSSERLTEEGGEVVITEEEEPYVSSTYQVS